jgi:aminoglycoside phosphotransferase (APT) family kinase protein
MAILRRREPQQQWTVDPARTAAVTAAVQDQAAARLGSRPALASPTEPVLGGYAFQVRLAVNDGPWSGILVARDAEGDDAAVEHEYRWMATLAAAGFPVPAPLAAGPGMPLVFRQPTGVTLAEKMVTDMAGIPALMTAFAGLHTRLHGMAPTGLRDAPADPLDELAEATSDAQVAPSVADELRWLRQSRPPTKDPVPCHGQLSPVNVWLDGDRASAVGWAKARLADPEYDVAYTVTGFWAAAIYLDNSVYRKGMKMARDPLVNSYLDAYRSASPRGLDDNALRYWQVHHLTALVADCTRRELDLITGPADTAAAIAKPKNHRDEIKGRIRELAGG